MNRFRRTAPAVGAGAVAVLVGGAALVGCGTIDAGGTQRKHTTFTVADAKKALTVRADGPVTLVGGDVTDVSVRRTESWTNRGNKPDARHTVRDGALELTSRCGGINVGGSGCGVAYRITVPRTLAVTVRTDHGSLTGDGLTGPLSFESDSGSVRLTNLRVPSLRVGTDNGAIHTEGSATTMDLRSDSGSIHAIGLTTRNLTAVSSNGSIHVAGTATTTDLRSDSGSVHAERMISDTLGARTDTGGVNLAFAKPPTRLTARSDTGSVSVDLPVEVPYRFRLTSDTGGRDIDNALRDDDRSHRIVEITTDTGGINVLPA